MDSFKIEAEWDAVENKWVATSEDIPGLVAVGSNIPELVDVLKSLVPDLLEANSHLTGHGSTNKQKLPKDRCHLEIDCRHSETVYI